MRRKIINSAPYEMLSYGAALGYSDFDSELLPFEKRRGGVCVSHARLIKLFLADVSKRSPYILGTPGAFSRRY